ncbi:MAG: hypothetical protein ABIG10_00645 [bacterium]
MPKQKKQLNTKPVNTGFKTLKKKPDAKPKIKIKHVTSESKKKNLVKGNAVVDLKKNFSELYHEADSLLDDEEVTEKEMEEQDSNFDWGNLLEEEDGQKKKKKIKKKKGHGFKLFGSRKHDKLDSKTGKKHLKSKKLAKKISKDVIKDLPEPDLKKGFPMRIYRKLAVGFVLLAIILIAVIFYFSFVKATIIISLKEGLAKEDITISVYERGEDYVIPDNAVRGLVKEIELEHSKAYDVTGSEVIGEEVTGTVTIINDYMKNQPLVATTRLLSSDGKLFRLKNSVNVPAGKSITADVYADQQGADMVVGDESFTIPGLWEGLQDKIYAKSQAGDITYKKKLKRVLKQEDIDSALKDLQEMLIEKAKTDIDDTYSEYNQKLYEINQEAIEYEIDSEIGEEVDKFSITMNAVIIVVAFDDAQVYEFAQKAMSSNLSDNKELSGLRTDEFSYEIAEIDLERKIADVGVEFSGSVVLKPDAELVDKSKIINMTKEQVADYLTNIEDIKTFDIKISPSFVNKTPSLVDRIKIEIK